MRKTAACTNKGARAAHGTYKRASTQASSLGSHTGKALSSLCEADLLGRGHLPPPPAPPPAQWHTCRAAGRRRAAAGGAAAGEAAAGAGAAAEAATVQSKGSSSAVRTSSHDRCRSTLRNHNFRDSKDGRHASGVHLRARRPEAASPSSSRTPAPATGGLAPAPVMPALSALLYCLRAAPLSISFSRWAIKYLRTAGRRRE